MLSWRARQNKRVHPTYPYNVVGQDPPNNKSISVSATITAAEATENEGTTSRKWLWLSPLPLLLLLLLLIILIGGGIFAGFYWGHLFMFATNTVPVVSSTAGLIGGAGGGGGVSSSSSSSSSGAITTPSSSAPIISSSLPPVIPSSSPPSLSSSSSSTSVPIIDIFVVYGQSNGQGFGSTTSPPFVTGGNASEYVIDDAFSQYFYFQPGPYNRTGKAGKIIPFLQEPILDSHTSLETWTFCSSDNGGNLIGFTANFANQWFILNPGHQIVFVQCAVGGAGYGPSDPAGNSGLSPSAPSAYWGVGSPLSERCKQAVTNTTQMLPTARIKGFLDCHGQ